MAERDQFETLFREFLTGTYSRRQAMLRAAGAGAAGAAAVVGVRGHASAAPLGRGALAASRHQDETPKPGGILKMGMQADPTSLDPQKQSLTAIWKVVEHIYNRLTRIMPDLSVVPELAESWTISDDGLVYTFKLRQGVTFHNGRAVVAADVKYSYERLLDPATAAPSTESLATMASIEAPDDATVVLTVTGRDASLLANLASSSLIIMPKEVVEENGDLSQVAVGSGPFSFVEYTPNTRVVLEKYAGYWETGMPYLDGLELLIASEDNSRTAALVSGTVDFIEYVPSKDIELLQADSSIVLAGNSIQQIRMLGFNLRREPFTNLKVRQAIAAVLDRQPIIDASLFGFGTATDTLFAQDSWAALPREIPPPDIEKGKALLAEAGFPDGFQTTITAWSEYDFLNNSAIVIQEQLKAIGIEAEVNAVENATMIQEVYVDHEFDMVMTGNSGFVDPSSLILDAFKSDEAGNFTGYNNPQVDELIIAGIAETDQAKRAEIYQQIQQILLEEVPWVSLYIGQQYEAMKSYVKGYEHNPTGANQAVLWTWLDK